MIINHEELTDLDFETLNIIYDIFIDVENYQEIDIKCDDHDILSDCNELINANQHGLIIQILRTYEKYVVRIDEKSIPNNAITLWKHLFLAKKTRAILQSIGTKEASKFIDEIAEYLLSKLPNIYEQDFAINKCEEGPPDFGQKKFLILFYNEISQCCSGYLNTGYAEKSLKYYRESACHYELLGLYNKALGLTHHENKESREQALNYYDEIIITQLLSYKYDIDIDIWKLYVIFPAIYHKAEVLIKLQRGKESIDILENLLKEYYQFSKIGFDATIKYKIIESMILNSHAKIESSSPHEIMPIITEIEDIRKEIKSYSRTKEILCNRFNSLEAKYYIEKVRNNPINNDQSIQDISDALKITKILYENEKNEDEKIQASFLWLDAFKQYLKVIKDNHYNKGNHYNIADKEALLLDMLNVIFGRIENSERWIPNKVEILKLIVEVLEEINDDGIISCQDIKDREKKYCLQLIQEKNKPSSYQKVKSYRRLLLLGENDIDIEKDYRFPESFEAIKEFANNGINKDYYTQRLRYNSESFDRNLIYNSYWPQLANRYAFTVLRKWQSYTPSLGSYSISSRGGGYFVYKVSDNGNIVDGIVVDPGYDFIENFIEHNFSIKDITTIAITHSHIDHSVDFRGLITLIHEMNKRGPRKIYNWVPKKVMVVLTPSCFDHFFQVISESRDCIKDVVVVDPDRQDVEKGIRQISIGESFVLTAIPACHKEVQKDANCVGYILKDNSENKLIGFTGDTVWTNNLFRNLENCSVICANMGSLIDVNKGDSFEKTFNDTDDENKNIKKLIYKENHLYLPGIITLLEELQKSGKTKITVIGELGEELKSDLRKDLFYKFNEFINVRRSKKYGNKTYKWWRKIFYPYPLVAIEDLNLTITWEKQNTEPFIRCSRCKKIIPPDKVRLRVTNDERNSEQLFYYCKECLEVIESLESGMEKEWEKRYLPPQ